MAAYVSVPLHLEHYVHESRLSYGLPTLHTNIASFLSAMPRLPMQAVSIIILPQLLPLNIINNSASQLPRQLEISGSFCSKPRPLMIAQALKSRMAGTYAFAEMLLALSSRELRLSLLNYDTTRFAAPQNSPLSAMYLLGGAARSIVALYARKLWQNTHSSFLATLPNPFHLS